MNARARQFGWTLVLGALLQACARPPEAVWTAPLTEDTESARAYMTRDWVLAAGRQLYGWRRKDGKAGLRWPEPAKAWIDGLATLPEHVAVRSDNKVVILDPATLTVLAEEGAEAGPFEAGGRFYWSLNGIVRSWHPSEGLATAFSGSGNLLLNTAAAEEGTLLLALRRSSDLHVTLNKGLVVGGLLVALNADGSERWRLEDLPYSPPLIHQGTAYFSDSKVLAVFLHAVSLADGSQRWKRGFGNAPSDPAKAARTKFVVPETPRIYPLLCLEDSVIAAVEDGDGRRVLGLDPATGDERWAWEPLTDVLDGVGNLGDAFSAPTLLGAQGPILLGVGARIRALKAQGGRSWAFAADKPVRSAPAADADGWAATDMSKLYYFPLNK